MEAKSEKMKSVNEWVKAIHDNAVEHGWWDEERSIGDIIALCHSELSEALEEYRSGNGHFYPKDGKPEGIDVELIDCVIRIFDYLGHVGADVEALLSVKHMYNLTRPYRHGGKVL